MKIKDCLQKKGYTLTNDNKHVVAVSYSDVIEIVKEYTEAKVDEQRALYEDNWGAGHIYKKLLTIPKPKFD